MRRSTRVSRSSLRPLRHLCQLLSGIVAGQKLKDMAVWILEINPTPTIPVVELHVVARPRLAAIGQATVHDTTKNLVKLGLAHLESVVRGREARAVVEVQRQGLIGNLDGREMAYSSLVLKSEDTLVE